MDQLDFQTIQQQIKTGNLKYYNIYNLDVSAKQHFAVQYYINHPHDNLEEKQKLSISFCDIECYTNHSEFGEVKNGSHPINAITEINTLTNTITSFFLLTEKNFKQFGLDDTLSNLNSIIQEKQELYYNQLLDLDYIDKEKISSVKLYLFNNDLDLIKAYFEHVHKIDPLLLGGFNSDSFDYPYIYYRLRTLLNGNVQAIAQIMSKLNYIEVKGNYISIPEFSFYDVLHFFKPRDEGGLNYGKKQPMYNLDWLGETILGTKKLAYKDENMSLDDFYENDPTHFLLYNIMDTCITKNLSDKLDHISTHNNIRRLSKVPFSFSIRGTSAIYDTFILFEETSRKKYIRFGISTEKGKYIKKEVLQNFPVPIIKRKKIQPADIKKRQYMSLIAKYSGAYVKTPRADLISKGLIIDLDASSLYPSMMVQSNISFDTFQGYVLNPCTYTILQGLEQLCSKTNKIPKQLPQKLSEMILQHVKINSYQNKSSAIRDYYYTTLYLYSKIIESNYPMSSIYKPANTECALLLKLYLIPMLDIINTIHAQSTLEYNQFVYDYFFLDPQLFEKKYNVVYIVTDIFDTTSNILKLDLKTALRYIQNHSVTIAGTLFDKHEKKIGLFYNIITNLWALRTSAKKMRDTFEVGSEEYNMYDRLQVTYKVATNSLYGVFGLSTFRYSSHLIAQSITAQGRLINKIAQYVSEQSLEYEYGPYPKV